MAAVTGRAFWLGGKLGVLFLLEQFSLLWGSGLRMIDSTALKLADWRSSLVSLAVELRLTDTDRFRFSLATYSI